MPLIKPKLYSVERRFVASTGIVAAGAVSVDVELRAMKGTGGMYSQITGYAAVFNSLSGQLGDKGNQFRERIKPGAFARAINTGMDVRGLFNHDANCVLGRTKNNTLTLQEDGKGLRFSIDVNPDDPDAQGTAAKIARGDVDGCSFAFRAKMDDWTEDDEGRAIRELQDVDLFDVGPVTYPAYQATSVGTRGSAYPDDEDLGLRIRLMEIELDIEPEQDEAHERLRRRLEQMGAFKT